MKKMILAVMAAMVVSTAGTALAATPDYGYCRDGAPRIETNFAYCGGGHHGEGHGGYGHGGGYCYDNGNNEG